MPLKFLKHIVKLPVFVSLPKSVRTSQKKFDLKMRK